MADGHEEHISDALEMDTVAPLAPALITQAGMDLLALEDPTIASAQTALLGRQELCLFSILDGIGAPAPAMSAM
ncbi:hypothetical protein MY11210_002359 [Beauveria gryllotalpidicola]